MTDEPTLTRLVLEMPLDTDPAWIERVKRIAAPHVVRLGVVEHPEKQVVICELEPHRKPALAAALQKAWAEEQHRLANLPEA